MPTTIQIACGGEDEKYTGFELGDDLHEYAATPNPTDLGRETTGFYQVDNLTEKEDMDEAVREWQSGADIYCHSFRSGKRTIFLAALMAVAELNGLQEKGVSFSGSYVERDILARALFMHHFQRLVPGSVLKSNDLVAERLIFNINERLKGMAGQVVSITTLEDCQKQVKQHLTQVDCVYFPKRGKEKKAFRVAVSASKVEAVGAIVLGGKPYNERQLLDRIQKGKQSLQRPFTPPQMVRIFSDASTASTASTGTEYSAEPVPVAVVRRAAPPVSAVSTQADPAEQPDSFDADLPLDFAQIVASYVVLQKLLSMLLTALCRIVAAIRPRQSQALPAARDPRVLATAKAANIPVKQQVAVAH